MAIQEIAAALTSDEIISGVLSVAITLGVIAIFKVHAEYIIYFILFIVWHK